MKTKILIADDHQIVVDGIRSLLDPLDGIIIIGAASSGRDAVLLSNQHKPDIVIMDISMPDLNGIDAARQITQNNPDCKVIILSMHSSKSFVTQALEAGVSGYILKQSAFRELESAIRAIVSGEIYLSPKITGIVVNDYIRNVSSIDSTSAQLTSREREIVQLIAEGKSSKEIADILHTSPKTIENHRFHIMEKLNLHTIAELVKYAIREGLTSVEP